MSQHIEENVGSRASQVFVQLQEAIVRGEIKAGTKLREADLSQEYGISRAPLREALNRLESLKLVVKVPHVGAQVVNLTAREVQEIYLIRENLEALACRLAAVEMTQTELDELKQLLHQHEQYIQDQSGSRYLLQQDDLDFHYCIIQGSRNQMLVNLLCNELYQLVRMIRHSGILVRNTPAKALQEHWRIYEALSQRDGELAAMLMQRHISRARQSAHLIQVEDQV
ncbi:GntR family transcriptional regulator [Gynuella sunshinyii]|uniref:Transcriptional regulator n=1 Tax=Gynuella sunshinyii YC6258 TaxID=1445510 RepID=A0A0C5V5I7_9GAMM|nr:GntR family transcriptional regulator [Gynuella sunshinyii]AJQ94700.1 transcriptional regulator [Gynuella sunshinyii YC6258]